MRRDVSTTLTGLRVARRVDGFRSSPAGAVPRGARRRVKERTPETMQPASWYVQRLRGMSAGEIAWRLGSAARDLGDRVRVSVGRVPRPRSSRRRRPLAPASASSTCRPAHGTVPRVTRIAGSARSRSRRRGGRPPPELLRPARAPSRRSHRLEPRPSAGGGAHGLRRRASTTATTRGRRLQARVGAQPAPSPGRPRRAPSARPATPATRGPWPSSSSRGSSSAPSGGA